MDDLRNYCRECVKVMRKECHLKPTYNDIKEPCFVCNRPAFEYIKKDPPKRIH